MPIESDVSKSDHSAPSPHKFHRKRMRDRIAEHGPKSLADYELLEVLLYAVIPRRDTKPVAKALLARFKSFRHIMTAHLDELTEVDGIGRDTAIFILTMADVYLRITKEQAFNSSPILKSWDAVTEFLSLEIGYDDTESFIALFLGSNNKLNHYEILARGTVNRVAIYPREIVKAALKCHAVSVIIAHNHPSGDMTPSQQDINMTAAIQDALKTVDITLHDHLIIGKSEHQSFKQLGLL